MRIPSIATLACDSSEEAEAKPPLVAKATLVLPDVGVGVAFGVGVVIGVGVGVAGVGVTIGVGFGVGLTVGVGVVATLPSLLQASSSTMRLELACALLTTTLILVVVTAANTSFVITRFVLLMLPPGTVAQPAPFQYCTSKLVMP